MNIHKIDQGAAQVSPFPKHTKLEQSFQDALEKNSHSENTLTTDNPDAPPVTSRVSIHCGNAGIFHDSDPGHTAFKNFLHESMNFSTAHIRRQIDELSTDETGVNIDMEMLKDCLDLYLECIDSYVL